MPSPLDQLKRPRPLGRFAGLQRTTEPDNSPLLTTVKSHLRITSAAEDTILQIYIDGAVEYVEKTARRSLFNQAWTLTLDSFPADDYLDLYMGPVTAVNTFTTYDDQNAPTTTFSDYALDSAGERILLNDGATWPTDLRAHASVAVAYATGHGTTVADLPSSLLRAVLFLAGVFYANRDASCTVDAEAAHGVSDMIAADHRWRL